MPASASAQQPAGAGGRHAHQRLPQCSACLVKRPATGTAQPQPMAAPHPYLSQEEVDYITTIGHSDALQACTD
eukprot:COSAG01_NODE_48603_length_379_cov_1.939286_1_plen_72_part_10